MTEASTKYMGRFAPSPTGPLHFGSLVAALASYLDAKAHGGTWLLRMEDVDASRCKPEFAIEILRTLSAFGLIWDGEVQFQSARAAQYQRAIEQLAAKHVTYACACSRKEIADSALTGIEAPVYPGTCRHKGLVDAGNSIRIRTTDAEICFNDRVQGFQCQRVQVDIGDFVLKRRDGLFTYQLAVVVDDAEQKVDHVVRGADLLESTARQIHLQQMLSLPTPKYLHFPVVTNAAGQKLSKQTLAPAIDAAGACKLLRDALTHLGQTPLPGTGHTQPSGLLTAAVRGWNPNAIPKRRFIPIA